MTGANAATLSERFSSFSRSTSTRILASFGYRRKIAQLGIYYLRQFRLQAIRVGGRRVALSFPNEERDVLEHEFSRIVVEDCYRLNALPSTISTIVDIGANVGLFSIAARRRFPRALIHAYEPNPSLIKHLAAHCETLDVRYFAEAVGGARSMVGLRVGENSLHTVTDDKLGGYTPQAAFSEVLGRIGGRIDLLKLDCEGAEWSILADTRTWRNIDNVTMEYHLWANPGSTVEGLVGRLTTLGFKHLTLSISPKETFGLLVACRQNHGNAS